MYGIIQDMFLSLQTFKISKFYNKHNINQLFAIDTLSKG